jgi:hypothetical protein
MTLPSKPPSAAASANYAASKKVSGPVSDPSGIILMKDITQSLLTQYFPVLSNAPNILFVAMATWGFESGFKLLHRKGSTVDSQHPGAGGTVTNSSLIGKDYLYTKVIKNLTDNPLTSPTVIANINQGKYAHGVSACMGCYHVRGTAANSYMFTPNAKIVSDLGLAVNPGESIVALFPDTEVGLTRSIAAGLVVYDQKYKAYLSKGNSPSTAIMKSIIAYVGAATAKDSNNFSPVRRLDQVQGRNLNTTEVSVLNKLAAAGLTSDNSSLGSGINAIGSAGPRTIAKQGDVSNSSNRQASTVNVAKPADPPGCTS